MMDSHPATPPTSAQVDEIASRISKADPAALQLPNELQTIADTLSAKWVRSFVFSQSPDHVQHLLSSSLSMSSLLWKSSNTLVYPSSHPPLAGPSAGQYHHFSGHHLFVPVFASGHTTVGVGVVHGTLSQEIWEMANSTKGCYMRYNLRFVYNTRHGILLSVCDAHADNAYIFSVYRIVSTTMLSYAVGMFKRDACLARALGEDALRPQDLLSNLAFFQAGLYPRPCTICGRMDDSNCSCEFKLFHPTHDRDYDAFFQAMFHHTTTSTSTMVGMRKICKEGEIYYDPIVAGSRFSHDGVLDWDALHQVTAWSLWEFTQSLRDNPRESQALLVDCETAGSSRHVVQSVTTQNDSLEQKGDASGLDVLDALFEFAGRDHAKVTVFEFSAQGDTKEGGAKTSEVKHLAHDNANPPGLSAEPSDGLSFEERRRARNRLSARRCSMKRRMFREELEGELKATLLKVTGLRKKEHSLRTENLELRKRLETIDAGVEDHFFGCARSRTAEWGHDAGWDSGREVASSIAQGFTGEVDRSGKDGAA